LLKERLEQALAFVSSRLFRSITWAFAAAILVWAGMVAWLLIVASKPAFEKFGFGFLKGTDWDPVQGNFGALPFIWGTCASSALALLVATPLGLGLALFLTELAPEKARSPVSFMVEMLASIPSVVYGLWGVFVLAPFMRVHVDPLLTSSIGTPFFGPPDTGLSLFTAAVILAIMVVPTIVSISREVFEAVPDIFRESARALGATRWETMRLAVLGSSKNGILGAIMLALGRALGETMAVTMVIGNRPEVSLDLIAPSHSMASVIANEFTEAVSDIHLAALSEIGLLLMVLTLVLNVMAHLLVWATTRKFKGVRA
jgi:phosphate transport system permease protein